jgi:hypothetical protein
MDHIQDLTTTRILLRRGIESGYWTLEDLDNPSEGWAENAKRFHLHHPKYQQHAYRNLLRDGDSVQPAQTPPPDFDRTAEFPF